METQRIMVTGGAGFIGTNLVNELRSRGHEVLCQLTYCIMKMRLTYTPIPILTMLEGIFVTIVKWKGSLMIMKSSIMSTT